MREKTRLELGDRRGGRSTSRRGLLAGAGPRRIPPPTSICNNGGGSGPIDGIDYGGFNGSRYKVSSVNRHNNVNGSSHRLSKAMRMLFERGWGTNIPPTFPSRPFILPCVLYCLVSCIALYLALIHHKRRDRPTDTQQRQRQ